MGDPGSPPFRELALPLVKQGIPVIRPKPRSKVAIDVGWQNLATTAPNVIEEWHREDSTYNVGCVAREDELWFLDIDSHEVKERIEKDTGFSLETLTRTVQTLKGLWHLYFQQNDASRALGNCGETSKEPGSERKELWSARVHNRYVVGPGSYVVEQKDGKPPISGQYRTIGKRPIVEAPERLIAWLKINRDKEHRTESAPRVAYPSGERFSEGGRNNTLASLAGSMRKRGMTHGAIEAALLAENGARCDPPLPESDVRKIAASFARYPGNTPGSAPVGASNPWDAAESMGTFLSDEDVDVEFLDAEKRMVARECVTEIFSPRGLGKTLFALWLAVLFALRGLRVLLIDRDNPRREVRKRLRAFGANGQIPALKVITREKCPPLTNTIAWSSFPYSDYDIVMIDSFDSAAEGVGEQDSAKPSRAVAPLLDIARRENGPSVLILGNTVRTGAHSRGSGVIEDRADIVYEVRDATLFHPSGAKPWVEELPPAHAASWASRASRRKQRERYRLAFVATKFRVGQEPEPFIVEIDTTTEPWSVREVTDEVDQEGAESRQRKAAERAEAIQKAVDTLIAEIQRRSQTGEPAILKKQAEGFLTHLTGLKIIQREAREITESKAFELVPVAGKGHSKAVQLAGKKEESNRNSGITEGAKTLGENGAHFGCPPSMHPTEIDPSETSENSGTEKPPISVDDSLFTPPLGLKNGLPDDSELI
jgi:hypothetical protein